MTERPRGFEYKHLEVPQESALVDIVVNDHAKFWWEMAGSQTVVAKESHLEEGRFDSNNIYSVTTTERFVALDFKRATNLPNLAKVKQVEQEYFQTCVALRNLGSSPLDNYVLPHEEPFPIGYSVTAMWDPGYYLWVFTWGFLRDFKKIGIMGVLWSPYGRWKAKQGDRQEIVRQHTALAQRLQTMLGSNKDILNV